MCVCMCVYVCSYHIYIYIHISPVVAVLLWACMFMLDPCLPTFSCFVHLTICTLQVAG